MRLERALSHIGTEISHLSKVSNTIRRASKAAQIENARNFPIRDEEGFDIEPALSASFRRLIRERFHEIRQDAELREDDELEQRLTRSMTLRWRRVLHRRDREGYNAIHVEPTESKVLVAMPQEDESRIPAASQSASRDKNPTGAVVIKTSPVSPSFIQSRATTVDIKKLKKLSSSPSVISESRTIPLGNHGVLTFPVAPGFAKKREHEQRMDEFKAECEKHETSEIREKLEEFRQKSLEKTGEITCPYCLYAVPPEVVFNQRKWE